MNTYVEINLKNIEENAKKIVKKYNDYKYYIAVLKSNAYGHGEKIVSSLEKTGINYIAVSYIDEALEIRKYNKDISILCLQPISLNDIDIAVKNNITITVHDKDYLDELLKLNKKLKVHIKLDTGMNRLGFKNSKEVECAYKKINESNYVLEGIYSHFATIGLFDKGYDIQVENFKKLTKLIDLKKIPIVHFSSSVILLSHPKLEFCTGARFGILLYGYNVCPSFNNNSIKDKLRNIRNSYYQKKYNISKTYTNVKIDVKPSMKMYTSIIQIKNIKKGESIGYGGYCVKGDIRVAILPIGYNNGIGTNSNRYVIINNKKYYSIGSIGMNMMAIKIDESVKINDKVLIMGDSITLGTMSRFKGDSISKTLLDIGKNNKRIYVEK